MSQEFQREARYAVFKFSKLNGPQSKILQEAMCRLPRVAECLVIESDWPEYEPVWQMIEARMTAAPVPPAGVICDEVAPITEQAWRSLELPPAGEVEVLKVQYRVSAGPQTGWSFWGEGNGDEFRNSYQVEVRELVDRAHVTRLQAENARLQADFKAKFQDHKRELQKTWDERDALKAEAEQLKRWQATVRENSPLLIQLDAVQSELTKARELLTEFPSTGWIAKRDAFLTHQSAPAAKGERYECIGKGGDYQVVAIAQGAGTLKGFNHYVYKNADGVHFVREPDDFLLRMQVKVEPRRSADRKILETRKKAGFEGGSDE